MGYCKPYSALERSELFLNIKILWYFQHKPAHLSNQVTAGDTSQTRTHLILIHRINREKFCSQVFAKMQLLALKQFPRSTAYSMYPDMLLLRKKVDGNQGAYSFQPKLCDLRSWGSRGTQAHLTMLHFLKMSVQLALRAFSLMEMRCGRPICYRSLLLLKLALKHMTNPLLRAVLNRQD